MKLFKITLIILGMSLGIPGFSQGTAKIYVIDKAGKMIPGEKIEQIKTSQFKLTLNYIPVNCQNFFNGFVSLNIFSCEFTHVYILIVIKVFKQFQKFQ